MLVLRQHFEIAGDEQKDKQIVDTQRLLNQVAGQPLQTRLVAHGLVHQQVESDNTTQNALQPKASRSFISWVYRLKTNRSSSSSDTTKTMNANQKRGVFSMRVGRYASGRLAGWLALMRTVGQNAGS